MLKSQTENAWVELEEFVAKIGRLPRSNISVDEFCRELLQATISALTAEGGAIWFADNRGSLSLRYHQNHPCLRDTISVDADQSPQLQERKCFLQELLTDHQPKVLGPNASGICPTRAEQGEDSVLFLAPITVAGRLGGVLELVQHRCASPTAERGVLRLLSVVGDVASEYLQSWELKGLRQQQRQLRALDQFARAVHSSLDLPTVAHFVANEARSICACDRATLIVRHGRTWRVVAVSGVSNVDRRSNSIRALERLAKAVVREGCVLRFDGRSAPDPPTDSTKSAEPLAKYCELASPRSLLMIPLDPSRHRPPAQVKAVCVLLFEQFGESGGQVDETIATSLADHANNALGNALAVHRVPARWFVDHTRRAPSFPVRRTALRLICIGIVAVAVGWYLTTATAPFHLTVGGELYPRETRDLFAPLDGEIVDLRVEHDQIVETGTVLLTLSSPQLDLDFQELRGERKTLRKRLLAVETARVNTELTDHDATSRLGQLTAEGEVIRQQLQSNERQMDLVRHEREKLSVRSPIAGRVITWDAERLLQDRPVRRGQVLLTIARLDGPWMANLRIPDHHVGYVTSAQQERGSALQVAYSLTSDPAKVFFGEIRERPWRTEVEETTGGSVVSVTMELAGKRPHEPRPGTPIAGHVICGRRPVGYIWCHDLIEKARGLWHLYLANPSTSTNGGPVHE